MNTKKNPADRAGQTKRTEKTDPADTPADTSARLNELRAAIDATDRDLIAVLNRRAGISREIGALKAHSDAAVFRPEREAALLDKLSRRGEGGALPEEHLRAIYREIISSSRALQKPLRVAYLGPEGTFSHMAAQEFLGHETQCVSVSTLAGVFDAVQKRDCDLGAVPVENSLNGTVGQSLDAFARYDVTVQSEWYSRIRLSLISREESIGAVRVVYSHPQPLGQATNWLNATLPGADQVPMASTAAAALRASEEYGSAAVGDARLAERLGLRVLARNIEDLPDNWTRFFIIGLAPARDTPGVADKSSIMFSLPDKAGSLVRVLEALAAGGINISKLESRPIRGQRWKYIFFADLDCDVTLPEHAPTMADMAGHCLSARVLGAYRAGRYLQTPR